VEKRTNYCISASDCIVAWVCLFERIDSRGIARQTNHYWWVLFVYFMLILLANTIKDRTIICLVSY